MSDHCQAPPVPNHRAGAQTGGGAGAFEVRGAPGVHLSDLTSAAIKKRMAFQQIKEKCSVRKIRYGFRHPARFVITVNDNTGVFDTPADAEIFLRRGSRLEH